MVLSDCLLDLKDVSFSYSGAPILRSVNLRLNKAEIHALVGENGAGKSSLFKCIMGIISPSDGEIIFFGENIKGLSVREVLGKGISMIHQELMLIPELTVAENIYLGREHAGGKRMSLSAIQLAVQELFDRFGLDIPVDARVKDLSIARQQIVEIMRSVSQEAKLILMDEPTSSLTDAEIQFFTRLIRDLKESGVGILFTSHKMEEIFGFADFLTVLRDGEVVGTYRSNEIDAHALVQKMVGRELKDFYPKAEVTTGDLILEVENLGLVGVFEGINFEVRAGEVVGLAGLVGAGRTDIGQSIFGIQPYTSGEVRYLGKVFTPKHPSEALEAGMAYLGEDRKELGIIPEMNITENMTLGLMRLYQKWQRILFQKEKKVTEEKSESLSIRMAHAGQKIQELSGGNQQKVLFGRMLLNMPNLLILDEPTRGIDVVSKFDIYRLILELKQAGKGILLISSDMTELLEMSDRVVVISKGGQRGELNKQEASPERVLQLALHA
jgi:ABC-type sugar transport system ATPase subunit